MTMIYDIYHKTTFEYQSPVSFSHNIARLQPTTTPIQSVLDFSMTVEPAAYETYTFEDLFGNINSHLLIREPHQTLSVTGTSRVERFPERIEANVAALKERTTSYGKALERLAQFHADDLQAKPFLFESELIPNNVTQLKAYALESFHKKRDVYDAGEELMTRIFDDFEFLPGFSDITTPVEEIFEARKGVCQDFAQLAIAALRSIGLPAKYMSGYIETLPPEGKEKLFGADASHAWFAVYIPGAGWAEFDPTNNMVPSIQHILLGSGRDYHDIAPLKGVVFSSGNSRLSVMVDVRQSEQQEHALVQSQKQSASTQSQQAQMQQNQW